ncbi:MAG: hypothetical protein M1826_006668 [Phylliscum demangeonii]|nr:MAG: hypothetical protein M1826_006668 [Phylliscum demangeonii]
MNWTGGSFARHSAGHPSGRTRNARNGSLTRRQRQHFARARSRPQALSSPSSCSLSRYRPAPAQAEDAAPSPVARHQPSGHDRSSPRLVVQHAQAQAHARPPSPSPSPLAHRPSGPEEAGQRPSAELSHDHARHARRAPAHAAAATIAASVPEQRLTTAEASDPSSSWTTRKTRLLSRTDWVGASVSGPLRLRPPDRRARGKRRRLDDDDDDAAAAAVRPPPTYSPVRAVDAVAEIMTVAGLESVVRIGHEASLARPRLRARMPGGPAAEAAARDRSLAEAASTSSRNQHGPMRAKFPLLDRARTKGRLERLAPPAYDGARPPDDDNVAAFNRDTRIPDEPVIGKHRRPQRPTTRFDADARQPRSTIFTGHSRSRGRIGDETASLRLEPGHEAPSSRASNSPTPLGPEEQYFPERLRSGSHLSSTADQDAVLNPAGLHVRRRSAPGFAEPSAWRVPSNGVSDRKRKTPEETADGGQRRSRSLEWRKGPEVASLRPTSSSPARSPTDDAESPAATWMHFLFGD